MNTSLTPLSLDQVADHLERMLLRYEELQKSNALLQAQLLEVMQERDALRARLAAARARVDTLLARMPAADTALASNPSLANASKAGSGSTSATGASGMHGISSATGAEAGKAHTSPVNAANNQAAPQQAAIAPSSLLAALTAHSGKHGSETAPSSKWGEKNT